MANQIEKVNTIAITSIEKINLLDDDAIEKLNLLEFTAIPNPTWSSGPALHEARQGGGMVGTQTAALYISGYGGSSPGYQASCSRLESGSWAVQSGGNIVAAKTQMAAGGLQDDAISVGGSTASAKSATVEVWGGSSWATDSSDPLGTATTSVRGCGAAALQFLLAGGDTDAGGQMDTAYKYSGTWAATSDANMTASTKYHMMVGIWTAALVIGGGRGYGVGTGAMHFVEEWDDSAWATLSETLVGHQRQQSGTFGTVTAAVVFGGSGTEDSGDSWGRLDTTEQWNGTAWSVEDDYTAVLDELNGCGTTTAGLGAGGYTGVGAVDTTQDYD